MLIIHNGYVPTRVRHQSECVSFSECPNVPSLWLSLSIDHILHTRFSQPLPLFPFAGVLVLKFNTLPLNKVKRSNQQSIHHNDKF
jgi:hypothetical protein